jgi:hypothetical protein
MGGITKKVVAEVIDYVSDRMKKLWQRVGDNMLSTDDEKFLGIKTYAHSKVGTFLKDIFYDHSEETTVIILAYLTWYYMQPLLYNQFGAYGAMAEVFFNITTSLIYAQALNSLANISQNRLMEEYAISRAVMNIIANESYMYRMANGTIYDWLAGGSHYNDVESGGVLFCVIGRIDKYAKIFGLADGVSNKETMLKDEVMARNFAYSSYAGGVLYNLGQGIGEPE